MKLYTTVDIGKVFGISYRNIIYLIRRGIIKPTFVIKRLKHQRYIFDEKDYQKSIEIIQNYIADKDFTEKLLK